MTSELHPALRPPNIHAIIKKKYQEDITIWIDLDNSPHVVFFKPIIEELEKCGYKVLLTTRDCFQVSGLADLYGLKYTRIGRHYGKNKLTRLYYCYFTKTRHGF